MPRDTTMLELVSALSAQARSGTRFEGPIGEPSWQPVSVAAFPEEGAR